jgi:hypothetical protein
MANKEKWLKDVEKEYGSLESYVLEEIKGGAEPLLFGYSPFQYLLKKGLLKEGDIIRTNLQGNSIDGHYAITSEGNLKGIEAAEGLYSGKSGIYKPYKILNLKNSDNGWTLGFIAQSRIASESKL